MMVDFSNPAGRFLKQKEGCQTEYTGIACPSDNYQIMAEAPNFNKKTIMRVLI
jgi:hypothetical protein